MGKPLIDLVNLVAFAAGTSGGSGASTPILDMDGYEGVLFLAYQEATNTSNQLVARGGSATASLTEYTGPQTGEASGTLGSLYLDVFRPEHRYIDGIILTSAGAVGNTVITALRYGARSFPTTQATAGWNGRALATPNTGTATASG